MIELPYPHREDYNIFYGQYYRNSPIRVGDRSYIMKREEKPIFIDYKDKIVLDIGADLGSTASFFLDRGAKQVIAVEKDEILFGYLKKNFYKYSEVIPIHLDISKEEDISQLLIKYQPDIVQMDCEGCEGKLLNVENEVIQIPGMYIVELHNVPFLKIMEIPEKWLCGAPEEYKHDEKMIVKDDFSDLFKKKLEECGFEIVSTLEWSSDRDQFYKHSMEIIYAEKRIC